MGYSFTLYYSTEDFAFLKIANPIPTSEATNNTFIGNSVNNPIHVLVKSIRLVTTDWSIKVVASINVSPLFCNVYTKRYTRIIPILRAFHCFFLLVMRICIIVVILSCQLITAIINIVCFCVIWCETHGFEPASKVLPATCVLPQPKSFRHCFLF